MQIQNPFIFNFIITNILYPNYKTVNQSQSHRNHNVHIHRLFVRCHQHCVPEPELVCVSKQPAQQFGRRIQRICPRAFRWRWRNARRKRYGRRQLPQHGPSCIKAGMERPIRNWFGERPQTRVHAVSPREQFRRLFRKTKLRVGRFGPGAGRGAQFFRGCLEDVCRARAGHQ